MRTVLFLFLNPTQRTIRSPSFRTQQSFGGILCLGLRLLGWRSETRPDCRCPVPAEKDGVALLILSAGRLPSCSRLLSRAVDMQEPSGAVPGTHRSASFAWTLQPGSMIICASPRCALWCAVETALAAPLGSVTPPIFAFSK